MHCHKLRLFFYNHREHGTEPLKERYRTHLKTYRRTPLKTFSLSAAAKVTGKSKSVLSNAIKKGTLSAGRGAGNSYVIDPAELHRVYGIEFDEEGSALARTPSAPPIKNTLVPQKEPLKEHDTSMLERALNAESKAAVLQAELEGVKARLNDAIGQGGLVDVHKDAAEHAKQETITLRALLTDQRERVEKPTSKRWWQRS